MIFDLLLPEFQDFSYMRRILLFVHWKEHKLVKSRNFAALPITQKPIQTRRGWGGAGLHRGMLPPLPQPGRAPSDPSGTQQGGRNRSCSQKVLSWQGFGCRLGRSLPRRVLRPRCAGAGAHAQALTTGCAGGTGLHQGLPEALRNVINLPELKRLL